MKKTSAFVLFLFAAVSLDAAVIGRVDVRQQWPWSTDITVDYTLSGVTAPVNLTVKAYNGDTELPLPAKALSGDVYGVGADGTWHFTIDPVTAFGTAKAALSDFRVTLDVTASAANINEALYKIFDLTTGACTDVTRRALLNGVWGSIETDYAKTGSGFTAGEDDVLIWTGVTNSVEYKTAKMVMRKVHAQNKVWQSGDAAGTSYNNCSTVPRYWVKLTYDYYIAVFETTQAQWKKIRSTLPTGCAAGNGDGDLIAPVNNITYYDVYGHPNSDYAAYNGVVTGEKICFPTNSYVRDVGKLTFAATMWSKTGYEFTLPTLAEWEFACRGGNDGPLYSGKAQTVANVDELAWHSATAGGAPRPVGQKAPNVYGLYDTLGNVLERVLGSGQLNQGGVSGTGGSQSDPVVNPLGNPNTTKDTNPYCCGGGSWDSANGAVYDCRHAARYGGWYEWYAARTFIGFRFVIPGDGTQWAAH